MDQAHIYRDHAREYDALVTAEDHAGNLVASLAPLMPHGGTLVDVGTGTGRISRLLAAHAGRIIGVERAPAMLEVAAAVRAHSAHPDWQLVLADARELPLPDAHADLVVAGWVFGHFRHWMPDNWRGEVDQALAEMTRVAKPGANIVVIETLGTDHETPRRHAALDEYFERLEAQHQMVRTVLRTDYRFADLDSAAALLGLFFGPALAQAIRARGSTVVPECTGLWLCQRPAGAR